MTVVFYTNFINHHQVPLADEFYHILGDDYKMVTFEPLPESFRLKGYADYSYKPYLIEAFRSDEYMERAHQLSVTSDVVILGAAPECLIHERLRINKITFRYGERLFKKIDRRFLRLSYWKGLCNEHTQYRNKPLFMLAASAYMKSDVTKLFAYPNKVFKWGYFTKASDIDIHKVLESKRNIDKIRILWCGSIAQVKRPDLIVQLAYMLKKENINFNIDMVGEASGWSGLIQDMIVDLDVADCVSMLGSFPNEQVLRMMQEYHIFAFTSDRGEGWGVVLNEAMGNGCTVVASNRIGAAPFLIKNRINGLLFESGNVQSLYEQILALIDDREFRESLAIQAYHTISEDWSPRKAAENFIRLAEGIVLNSIPEIEDGPCSKALTINHKKLLR